HIFEDGHLTDSQGRRVDFKNTVVIMTSNLGAREIQKSTPMGFKKADIEDLSYEDIKNKVMGELKKTFKPEFLNRVDEVIVFHKLTRDQVFQIIDLMISRIQQQLSLQGLEIELKDSAKELLLKKGYDPVMGARPMRRCIQNLIEDPLSEKIISGEIRPGQKIVVSAEDDKMNFEIKRASDSILKV
ncbi:MAG: ATP-dependent Clp protease ATP-binding subunit, partial [Actinobacteria bacterium]|nr:ATP-dependent Clp protease ATP-binding subunit [Actinomycetota bacterium]